MTTMTMTTRDELLGFTSRRYLEFEVDGMNQPVRIQSITEGERAQIIKMCGNELTHMPALLVMFGLVDEHGQRQFADTDLELIETIESRFVQDIAARIEAHCMLGSVDEEAAVKN